MKSLYIDADANTLLPLDLEALKLDLRISGSHLDSILSAQYIPAALSNAEAFLKRSLLTKAHRWIIDSFPDGYEVLVLPRGLCTAVSSIVYYSNGAPVTLTGPSSGSPAGADYQEALGSKGGGRVRPLAGETWPAVDSDAIKPIEITFTAGWTNDKSIPAQIRRGLTADVYGALEADGLLQIRQGFDIDFARKQMSAWRLLIA